MSLASLFRRKTNTLKLTDPTTTLKGSYLGNVSTNVAKGETCIDRPMKMLWANYVKTSGRQTVGMKITVDNSGLKVYTANQGLTHYWCHRISHFCVPKSNPKLFVWIYRHVGKKLKVELRCHCILLTSEKKAKALVELLTEKVAASLQEYRREKTLKHRRRLLHDKAASHLVKHGESPSQSRTKLLATSKNYKPPTEYSLASPTLTAISEEADCSSSEESDYNGGSPYSTLGRWTFKNKFRQVQSLDSSGAPDVNMNQLPDDGECDSLTDYSNVSGFATLPRQPRPRSTRHIEKKLLEDRLDLLLSNEAGSDGSEDNFEVEPGFQDDEEGFQDDAEGFQEDAEGFNEDIENSTVDRKSSGDNDEDDDSGAGSQSLSGAEASPVNSRPSGQQALTHQSAIDIQNSDEDNDDVVTPFFGNSTHQAPVRSFSDGFFSFDRSSLSSDCSDMSHDKQNGLQQQNSKYSLDSTESGIICAFDIASTGGSFAETTDDSDRTLRKDDYTNSIIINGYPKMEELNGHELNYEEPSSSYQDSPGITSLHETNNKINKSKIHCDRYSDFYCSDNEIEIIRIITRL